MDLQEDLLKTARNVANWLIYLSVIAGIAILAQLYFLVVPVWLFYSVLAGWMAYLLVAVAVTLRVRLSYPASMLLAILTLAVSLPQPEHYSFGLSLASLTFIVGSILQVGVLVSVGRYLLLERRESRRIGVSPQLTG
ncbi:MAG TPA: hypothetical protein VE955_08215 [Candidatus Dormibacteraeota bacterium]|nr:hypothetical protein [Candidatus Dormibacteraeota bacterium]